MVITWNDQGHILCLVSVITKQFTLFNYINITIASLFLGCSIVVAVSDNRVCRIG